MGLRMQRPPHGLNHRLLRPTRCNAHRVRLIGGGFDFEAARLSSSLPVENGLHVHRHRQLSPVALLESAQHPGRVVVAALVGFAHRLGHRRRYAGGAKSGHVELLPNSQILTQRLPVTDRRIGPMALSTCRG